MIIYFGEAIGTCIFLFLNLSIISNVVSRSGDTINRLLTISIGTAISYAIPLMFFGEISGGHFNPCITLACIFIDEFDNVFVKGYLISELIGAFVGVLLYNILHFRDIKFCEDVEQKRKLYVVVPRDKNVVLSFIKEFLASFIFMLGIIFISFEFKNVSKEVLILYYLIITFLIGLAFDYTEVCVNPYRDIFNRIIFTPLHLRSIYHYLYIFVIIIAPILGMLSATFVYKYYNIYRQFLID